MSNFARLDNLLKEQALSAGGDANVAYDYARAMAAVEGVVAVVSDLKHHTSRIFYGDFAKAAGIGTGFSDEDSIWEKKILSLMSADEQEAKFIAELCFYHYLKRLGPRRRHCYLMTKLRFRDGKGSYLDILHRMYYIYGADGVSVRFALCLYGPLTFDFKGRSVAVDSLTGIAEELDTSVEETILSNRERQVLFAHRQRHEKSSDCRHFEYKRAYGQPPPSGNSQPPASKKLNRSLPPRKDDGTYLN